MRAALIEVITHLPRQRRRQFYMVLVLMLLGAVAEVATIGAVIPFLSLLTESTQMRSAQVMLPLVPREQSLFVAAVIFSGAVIAAGLVRLRLAWSMQSFAYGVAADLALMIQRRILSQPYSFHVERNSATLLAALNKTDILVFEVLLPLMQALIAAVIAAFILAALIYIEPLTAALAATALGTAYILASVVASARLQRNSAQIARSFDDRMQASQESLGGIRDLIIDGTRDAHLTRFEEANSKLRSARVNTSFIALAPRSLVETAGIFVVAMIAIYMAGRHGGLTAAIPTLGAIALGAQRLLPMLQQIYSGSATARGQRYLLVEIAQLLQLSEPPASAEQEGRLPLTSSIRLENVSFTHPRRRAPTLTEITLAIPAGAAVALTGETGSGKSSLADLIMGLLEPTTGRIAIDGVELSEVNRVRWQQSIAHVPQSIFLADTTIAQNIALSRPGEPVDHHRAVAAAKLAQLHEFIASLPDGYETVVGERGVRLSGGQRQRLGIARAIYKDAPVLVLDEATSALDDATEAAVLDGLLGLREAGRTIIIIAHRASTIARCDLIARLGGGRLVELSTQDPIAVSGR